MFLIRDAYRSYLFCGRIHERIQKGGRNRGNCTHRSQKSDLKVDDNAFLSID